MKSFKIDHTKLIPSIYYHTRSGMIVTWDIRIKKPNGGDYLTPEIIHTIEHTLADYLRREYGNYRIVGIFPMGCQTGFYVVTRFMSKKSIYEAIVKYIFSLQRSISIPGSRENECGQYQLHDLKGAKKTMLEYYSNYLKYYNRAIKYHK